MYESRKNPPLPSPHFMRRLVLHAAGAMGLLLASLLIGMAGYGYFEDLAWRDAFLNSAMLLGAARGHTEYGRREGLGRALCAVRRPGLHRLSRPRVHTRAAPPVAQVYWGEEQ